jgi:hypothetical protein
MAKKKARKQKSVVEDLGKHIASQKVKKLDKRFSL